MNRWIRNAGSLLLAVSVMTQSVPAQQGPFDALPPDGAPGVPGGGGGGIGGLPGFPQQGGGAQPSPEQQQQEAITRLQQAAQLAQEAAQITEQGDIDGAIAKYDEALLAAGGAVLPDTHPIQFDMFLEKGRLLRELGYNQEALATLNQARSYTSSVTDATKIAPFILELGQTYLDVEDYNTAIGLFAQGIGTPGQGRNAELWFNKGYAEAEYAKNQQFATPQQRQEDIQKALDSYDRALRLDPEYAEAYFERGMTHSLMGNADKAIEDFEQAVKFNPTDSESIARLGLSSFNRGLTEGSRRDGQQAKIDQDLQQAITQMTKFLELVPPRPPGEEDDGETIGREDILLQRSAAYIAQGEEAKGDRSFYYRSAITDADEVIKLEPDAPDGFFQKGIALRMLGDLNGAIDAFGETLERSPNNTQALLRRGILEFRQGDIESAKADLRKAILYSGGDPRANFWIALCYSKTGEPRMAVRHYSAALKFQSTYNIAQYNRGLEYMKLGRFERAKADFNEVLRRDKSNAQARSMRDQAAQYSRR